jgi:hypothetical protein
MSEKGFEKEITYNAELYGAIAVRIKTDDVGHVFVECNHCQESWSRTTISDTKQKIKELNETIEQHARETDHTDISVDVTRQVEEKKIDITVTTQ